MYLLIIVGRRMTDCMYVVAKYDYIEKYYYNLCVS